MKKKQILTAVLPAVVMLAVILLNVASQRKVSSLYTRAYAAVQEDSGTAWEYLDQLRSAAPGYVPQYELYAQLYLNHNQKDAAYGILQTGIRLTGSKRLIQLADTLAAGADTLTDDTSSGALPDVLPEDWDTDTADSNTTDGTNAPVTYESLNYNFVVRYPDSNLDRQVQLTPGEGSGLSADGLQWTSSNPAVATVDATGLVTCGTRTGETRITAVGAGNTQAECWVTVLEPEIYADDGDSSGYSYTSGGYYFIPEGNFSLQVNANLDEALEKTQHGSSTELLPRLSVISDDLSGAATFDYGAAGGGAGTTAEVSGLVDENGNPILLTEEAPEAAEQPTGGEVLIEMGWESLYFSGEYRIPDHLLCNGSAYTTTTAAFTGYQNYGITVLSVPASVTSLSTDYNNPFSGYSALERFDVDEGNTAYRSVDGVLFSADGSRLIAYPPAATATEYTIPDGVTEIASQAFANNQNLQKLTIPASVREIGIGALQSMASLQEITVDPGNTAYRLEDGLLKDNSGMALALASGQAGEEYTLPAGVTQIDGTLFYENSTLRRLTVDASMPYLDLQSCSALEEVILNGDIRTVNFGDCPSLTHVVVNGSVDSLSMYSGQPSATVELNAPLGSLSVYGAALTLEHPENVTQSLTCTVGDTLPTGLASTLQQLSLDLQDNTQPLDLSFLSGNASMMSLQISNGQITDLAPLSSLPALSVLQLNHVTVPDWQPVWQCTGLSTLSITQCPDLDDISGVSALTELTSVDFSGTGISDLSPLAACQQLRNVSVNDCSGVTDLSPLDGLPDLFNISSYNTGVSQDQGWVYDTQEP